MQWGQDAAKAALSGATAPPGSGTAVDPYHVVVAVPLARTGIQRLRRLVVSARAVSGALGSRRNALTTDYGTESAMRGFGADIERVIKTDLNARRANSFDSPGMFFK